MNARDLGFIILFCLYVSKFEINSSKHKEEAFLKKEETNLKLDF
jgi:hypothetical protein